MRNARRLTLRRETLTPLSTGEMTSVHGGSHVDCTVTHGLSFEECPTPTLPINDCVANLTRINCPTISPDWCIWQAR